MTERLDEHNVSVDTELARAGACAQMHLPTGRICTRYPCTITGAAISCLLQVFPIP